jgi:two-component system OmpR family response regulator
MSSAPRNIFIVDDDPMITETMKDFLTDNFGHKVSVFPTGEDCLASLDENPDFIILDYTLNSVRPNAADGIEILHFIKVNYPKIRIIMLSAQEKHRTVDQTLEQGAEEFVYKDKAAFNYIAQLVNH